jgi:hypothetical protein
LRVFFLNGIYLQVVFAFVASHFLRGPDAFSGIALLIPLVPMWHKVRPTQQHLWVLICLGIGFLLPFLPAGAASRAEEDILAQVRLSQTKARILGRALELVPDFGWTNEALANACLRVRPIADPVTLSNGAGELLV